VVKRAKKELFMMRAISMALLVLVAGVPDAWCAGLGALGALRQESVELQTPPDTQILPVEMLDLGCGECEKWLNGKGWTEGKNQKADGFFFVYMDSAEIAAPPGHPNYVVSRQNAYSKAFLKAKGKLLKYLQTEVSREITYDQKEGRFVIEGVPPLASQAKPAEEEPGLPAIKRKAILLVNALLDAKLRQSGVQPNKPAPDAEQAQAAGTAQEIRNSSQFNEIVRSSASSQLKGVRRIHVVETVQNGKQGQICVVALYSPKTMAMADAIFGNEDLAPAGVPEKPLREQIADWAQPEGVRKLLSTFGTEMLRDEKGQFHLIAYAQSAPLSESSASLKNAMEKARLRAEGELRAFGQEHAAFSAAMQSREKSEELVNAMVNYESSEAWEQRLQSFSPPKAMTGITSVGTWAARHPLTGQAIVGSIVRWSPEDARDARNLKNEMNSPAGGQGGSPGKAGTSFGSQAYKAKGSYQGSASGGSNAQDF
jgi:hypothetical protein